MINMDEESYKYYKNQDYSVPPWIKYPEREIGSMFLRMGEGEEYLDGWLIYYLDLDKNQREEIKKRYPRPSNWGTWEEVDKSIESIKFNFSESSDTQDESNINPQYLGMAIVLIVILMLVCMYFFDF
jgi:hypothetical protein